MPRRPTINLPATLERSDEHARRIWSSTLRHAVETYGEGQRARRTAYASLKHSYERVGDRWEPKARRGPSDAQAARSGGRARSGRAATAGGVDANASKAHLLELARRLDIPGRSRMTKDQLVEAVRAENRRATRRSRSG